MYKFVYVCAFVQRYCEVSCLYLFSGAGTTELTAETLLPLAGVSSDFFCLSTPGFLTRLLRVQQHH